MNPIVKSYTTYADAAAAVRALEAAGVPHADISIVSGDKTQEHLAHHLTSLEDKEQGAAVGASALSFLGGGAGLLAGLGLLAVPGVGPVVAAGWLVSTLAGAGTGAILGGFLGSLTNAGVSKNYAQGYVDHVEGGGTLVMVRADETLQARVHGVLDNTPTTSTFATLDGDRRPLVP